MPARDPSVYSSNDLGEGMSHDRLSTTGTTDLRTAVEQWASPQVVINPVASKVRHEQPSSKSILGFDKPMVISTTPDMDHSEHGHVARPESAPVSVSGQNIAEAQQQQQHQDEALSNIHLQTQIALSHAQELRRRDLETMWYGRTLLSQSLSSSLQR